MSSYNKIAVAYAANTPDIEFPGTAWAAESPSESQKVVPRISRSLPLDLLVYMTIAGLVFVAWRISRMGFFEAGDDTGYWIGVAGGVMMVLLFSYPLRKHFSFARNWGRVKWWFIVHMFLGVGGPLLILLHSNFRVGSLNAAVALYSMVAVAVSGVIGRFIYARVNRGLRGEQASLNDLRLRAGLQQADAKSRLSFAPQVEARLVAFESVEIEAQARWTTYFRQVFWLPVRQWFVYRESVSELHQVLTQIARRDRWTQNDLHIREKRTKKLVNQYLTAVTRVAQFTAYERLFSLWHLAHIPFVYLLLISAVVHVIAVHMY